MTSNWAQSKSGLFTPADILSSLDGLPIPSTEAPLFQFLLGHLTTEWSMKNWETVWNSPIYDDVSNVWSVTMEGIDILKAEGFAKTSKGVVVSQMMARGLSLARTACWAMAVGSPMDALACYRMIYDRALTLQFLDKNGQYQEFEKYCWAEVFFWLSDGASLQLWRKQATRKEIQSHKDRQTKIRQKYFGGVVPREAWYILGSSKLGGVGGRIFAPSARTARAKEQRASKGHETAVRAREQGCSSQDRGYGGDGGTRLVRRLERMHGPHSYGPDFSDCIRSIPLSEYGIPSEKDRQTSPSATAREPKI